MKPKKNLEMYFWEPMIVEFYDGETSKMPFVLNPQIRIMATSLAEAEVILLKRYPDFYTKDNSRDWRFAGSTPLCKCNVVLVED